jgi:transposase
MVRKFKTADYEEVLDLEVRLRDVLPPEHLACFIVDAVSQLELSKIYSQYGEQGAPPYAPEIMLGLIFYGYATGVFSSRKIEKATYETIPFRYIAGDMHPDHATIAAFRKQFLVELKDLFVQILLMAQEVGHLELGNISLDGSKIHADASKSKAVSYKRLLEIELYLQAEIKELFALAEAADSKQLPDGMNLPNEIERRERRLKQLAEARRVLEARAQVRYEAELAEHQAKIQARQEKEAKKGRKLPGKEPKPPTPGARDKDQYNFTDPESRIMKNSNNNGFDQHYNVQVAVEHESRLIVGDWLCDHTNDKQAALPTIDTVPKELGYPDTANLDAGYFSETNIQGLLARGIDPYIATGRSSHNQGWRGYFLDHSESLPENATAKEKMAYKLRTQVGDALYRLRKSTVEPVIGIIKEVLGFRQFSLRGLASVGGEWTLVCLAYNLKRMHTLRYG